MLIRTFTIINKRGLHARAAAKFATTSALFNAVVKVRIFCADETRHWVDGKSVMSLMLLAATQGTDLEIQAEGEDAQQALTALQQLIDQRFDEDE
jgi:phosphocarrier protein HPr